MDQTGLTSCSVELDVLLHMGTTVQALCTVLSETLAAAAARMRGMWCVCACVDEESLSTGCRDGRARPQHVPAQGDSVHRSLHAAAGRAGQGASSNPHTSSTHLTNTPHCPRQPRMPSARLSPTRGMHVCCPVLAGHMIGWRP